MDKEEGQNNDMSMEDILSSIKGILSDNEQSRPEQKLEAEEKPEEEIYDLSASMIFDEHKPIKQEEQQEAEFSIEDLPLPENAEDTADELPEIKVEIPQIKIDVDSEPIFDAEEDAHHLAEESNQSLFQEQEESPISDEALDELIQSIDDDNNDEILTKELPSREGGAVEKFLSSEENEKFSEQQAEGQEFENQTDDVSTQEDTQSVSDEIINNFASMFSANSQNSTGVAEVDINKKIGDGAQTVEDLIKAVLRESLKPSIEGAITKIDENMLVEAKAAVEVEAKAWVDKNLTRVVEEIVREEVRRVMAKVGS